MFGIIKKFTEFFKGKKKSIINSKVSRANTLIKIINSKASSTNTFIDFDADRLEMHYARLGYIPKYQVQVTDSFIMLIKRIPFFSSLDYQSKEQLKSQILGFSAGNNSNFIRLEINYISNKKFISELHQAFDVYKNNITSGKEFVATLITLNSKYIATLIQLQEDQSICNTNHGAEQAGEYLEFYRCLVVHMVENYSKTNSESMRDTLFIHEYLQSAFKQLVFKQLMITKLDHGYESWKALIAHNNLIDKNDLMHHYKLVSAYESLSRRLPPKNKTKVHKI